MSGEGLGECSFIITDFQLLGNRSVLLFVCSVYSQREYSMRECSYVLGLDLLGLDLLGLDLLGLV